MLSLQLLLFVAIGAAGGFTLHHGSRSQACAIWANLYVATLYGAPLGFLLGLGRD